MSEVQAVDLDSLPVRVAAPGSVGAESGQRITLITASSAAELRNLAALARKKGEHTAMELEALADRMEAAAGAVARTVEEYVTTMATVGLHTEDLCDRLRAPVPHANGKAPHAD